MALKLEHKESAMAITLQSGLWKIFKLYQMVIIEATSAVSKYATLFRLENEVILWTSNNTL